MPVLAFEVTVAADDEDHATALLHAEGTLGIEVRPAGAASLLLAYFEEAPGLEDVLRSALDACPGASLRPVPVPEVDWVARFRESFRALDVGRFRIVPAWEDPPAGPDVLVVEPGRAFGTGTHESTRLCLAALEALAPRGLGRLADVGTGSAILAIAALRLGAAVAVGVDDDPEALEVARRHVALNGEAVALVRGDGGRPLRDGAFDTVVANITAPVLAARPAELAALARPGGRLVLAGLLVSDVAEVRAAYAGAGKVAVREDGDWASLLVERA